MTPLEQSLALCCCGNCECDIPLGYCHCRCGKQVPLHKRTFGSKRKGTYHQFLPGHWAKSPRTVLPIVNNEWGEIPLTQGQVALISAHRYEEYMQWDWVATKKNRDRRFYAVRYEYDGHGGQRVIYMHRQILGLDYGDPRKGDHINTVATLDNRDENLRICDHNQQMFNQTRRSNNTSGFKGVGLYKPNGRWRARIRVRGKVIYLGYFATREEAYEAYCKAAPIYHGEFARLN